MSLIFCSAERAGLAPHRGVPPGAAKAPPSRRLPVFPLFPPFHFPFLQPKIRINLNLSSFSHCYWKIHPADSLPSSEFSENLPSPPSFFIGIDLRGRPMLLSSFPCKEMRPFTLNGVACLLFFFFSRDVLNDAEKPRPWPLPCSRLWR